VSLWGGFVTEGVESMKMIPKAAMGAMVVTAVASVAVAQKTTDIHPGKGGSPHVRTEWMVDGANISIEYGRPYVKGRKIFPNQEPYGQVWRTGADEATVLTTDKPLTFGSLQVPAGKYSLWTVPGEKEWQLVINKDIPKWGTMYKTVAASDLGRTPMKTEKLTSPVEQFTISVNDTPEGGVLQLEWEHVRASAPFTVGK
jgi:hypothetical protein